MARSRRKTHGFLYLGLILALTVALISVLVLVTRPTVVELQVTARGAMLEVIPAADVGGEASAAVQPLRRTALLAPGLAVRGLEVRDAGCIEATLARSGPVVLFPDAGGSVKIAMEKPFSPELVLGEATRIAIDADGQRVSLDLAPSRPLPARAASPAVVAVAQRATLESTLCPEPQPGRDWEASVPIGPGMRLRLHDVGIHPVAIAGALPLPSDWYEVPEQAARFRILGGGQPESRLSLALPTAAAATSSMQLLDPAHGTVSEPQPLPMKLDAPQSLVWKDQVVLLEPAPAAPRPVQLLQPDLSVTRFDLSRQVKLDEESLVLGGKVRFPAGEREGFDIEPGSYFALGIDPQRPLRLRSLALDQGNLALVLWGEPLSLRVGFTPRLRAERLPSYFEWLATHKLVALVYGILAYVLLACVGVFQFFGWIKKG